MKTIFKLFVICGLVGAMSYTAQQADGLAYAASAKKKQASSTSLAGKKGNVRRRLPRGHRECGKAVEDYIKASGHSAYASTPMYAFNNSWSYICGSALNRRSIKEAEALALRACENGTRKWKNAFGGKCSIYASK